MIKWIEATVEMIQMGFVYVKILGKLKDVAVSADECFK